MFSSPLEYQQIDINKYQKCELIKKGGFGSVYKAQNKMTKKNYAAKVINEISNELLHREIEILKDAIHPTIIKYFGYSLKDFNDEDNVTILMELANCSLSDFLKNIKSGLGPKEYNNTLVQIILVGISKGMKYLHDRNIIHRDLKPDNILLDENFHPKISDFGLSKRFEFGNSSYQSKVGIGTPEYMAPEVWNTTYNRKADVYSFGILMYETITGLDPRPALNNNIIPDFNIKIENKLKNLILKCLSNDPKNRPSFGEIFEQLANDPECRLDYVDIDELNDYIDEISGITDKLEQLLQENKNYETKFIELNSLIVELREENLELKNEKILLLNDKEVSEKKDIEFNNQINILNSIIAEIKNEKKFYESKFEQLQNDNIRMINTNAEVTKELRQIELKYSNLSSKKDELSNNNRLLKEEKQQLEDKYNLLTENMQQISNDKKRLTKKEQQLLMNIDELKKQNSEAEKLFNIEKARLEEEMNTIKQINNELQSENEDIKKKSKDLQIDNEQNKRTINKLNDDLEQLKNKIQELSLHNNKLQKKKIKFKNDLDASNNKIQKLSLNITKLQDENDNLKNDLDTSNNEIQKLSLNIAKMRDEKDILKNDLDVSNNKIQELSLHITKLKDEKDNLKNDLDESNKIIQELSLHNTELQEEETKIIAEKNQLQKNYNKLLIKSKPAAKNMASYYKLIPKYHETNDKKNSFYTKGCGAILLIINFIFILSTL